MGWLSRLGTSKGGTFSSIARNFGGSQNETHDALNNYNNTMNNASTQMQQNYEKASKGIESGYGAAKNDYNNNKGVVGSRQELYQRMMGNGGYSPETVNKMKAGSTEQAGVQMRDAQNSIGDRYGSAQGGGMSGENLAKAMAMIGANKANALRDIDVGNAQLAEQQQTDAMPQLFGDAQNQAGLDIGQATATSGLTTEMAKALAEMASAQGGSNLQVGTQKNLLQSLWG